MDTDKPKPTPGHQVRDALAAARPFYRPRPSRDPKVWEYANSLDAMDFHIARYLVNELKVPNSLLPALVPLIDQRWFEDRLEEEVTCVLRELEDLE